MVDKGEATMRKKTVSDVVRSTAFHEAGPVVAAWSQGLKIRGVTIVPSQGTLGQTTHARKPLNGIKIEYDNSARARARAEDAIVVLLAGPAAERRHNPRRYRASHGAGDLKQAVDIATHFCSSDKAVEAYLNWLGIAAADQLAGLWDDVETIAKALIARRTLNAAEIAALLTPGAALAPSAEEEPRP
jgi:hypothetical protein